MKPRPCNRIHLPVYPARPGALSFESALAARRKIVIEMNRKKRGRGRVVEKRGKRAWRRERHRKSTFSRYHTTLADRRSNFLFFGLRKERGLVSSVGIGRAVGPVFFPVAPAMTPATRARGGVE